MFANTVIDSDEFFSLSLEAQLLYFHLGLKADDDGFVSVMKICKMLGFDNKPLEELVKTGFVIQLDAGLVVIKHWRVNNKFQNDRYHQTRYASYLNRLGLDENKEYYVKEPERNQDGTEMEPEWNQDGTEMGESLAQPSVAQSSVKSVAQLTSAEGSPEGGLQQVMDAVERQGIRVNDAVKKICAEECGHKSAEEVISKLLTNDSFRQRLKMIGGY